MVGRLDGKVAVITGGCSGIGLGAVELFVAEGACVIAADLQAEKGEMLEKRFPDSVRFAKCDVTIEADIAAAIGLAKSAFGGLDILANNAGVFKFEPVEAVTEHEFHREFDTNVLGSILAVQEGLKYFGPAGGSIINVSSTYGVVSPDQSMYDVQRRGGREWFKPVGYSVAKSGMLNFTRWLAEYCAHERLGVRVNSLVPGGVQEDGHPPEFVAEYEKRTPLGRMAREDDYNGAIVFLASRASAYMTGATLVVDGGWTAR